MYRYRDVQSMDNNWLLDAYVLCGKRYTRELDINFGIANVNRSPISINMVLRLTSDYTSCERCAKRSKVILS